MTEKVEDFVFEYGDWAEFELPMKETKRKKKDAKPEKIFGRVVAVTDGGAPIFKTDAGEHIGFSRASKFLRWGKAGEKP